MCVSDLRQVSGVLMCVSDLRQASGFPMCVSGIFMCVSDVSQVSGIFICVSDLWFWLRFSFYSHLVRHILNMKCLDAFNSRRQDSKF